VPGAGQSERELARLKRFVSINAAAGFPTSEKDARYTVFRSQLLKTGFHLGMGRLSPDYH
jgi:hypothetical protein